MPEPGQAISYTSYDGAQLIRYPWSGRHVAVLTESNALNRPAMTALLDGLDNAYDVYIYLTGREPSLFKSHNGLGTIVQVPTTFGTNGGALGYLGVTGIELSQAVWTSLYDGVHLDSRFDQAVFYEFGRNFWFYGNQLGAVDPFVTGFAIVNRFISMEFSGLAGAPYNGGLDFTEFRISILEDLAQTYLSGASYTLLGTIGDNQGVPSTRGWGAADLAGSLLYQVYEDFGIAEYKRFYEELELLPIASTKAAAIQNFITAAGSATGIDYQFLNKPSGTAFVTGSRTGDVITAAAAGSTLFGFGGNDDLRGSGGNDRLFGDNGNDLLNGFAAADELVGGLGNDRLFGGDGLDRLYGGDGDDILKGGSEDDWLSGGNGIDTADYSDIISGGVAVSLLLTNQNTGAGGFDLIFANVENLAGTAFADTLTGDELANVLDGGGGADMLAGGLGNDIYVVDNTDDTLIELTGEGDDTLLASMSYTLAAAVGVETLIANPASGTATIAVTGNEFAQSIFGNEGHNQLLGLGGSDQLVGNGGNDVLVGGSGIDYMRGGLGNDTYGIDENDIILENVGEGDDSLAANVGSYFLNDGASIESLSTANQAGTFAQNLTGNDFAQSVSGSEGANVLNGRLGNDLLRGYGGADIFLFDTAPGANNHDVIADMVVGADKIALQNSVFTALAEGNLGANAFRIGTVAGDAADRIIWDPTTNRLFYDADGNGAGTQVLFAIVNGSPNLQATDFIIV